MKIDPNLLILLIILTIVALAHTIHVDYAMSIANKTHIEPLLLTDTDYSNCEVGCLIACSNQNHVLQKGCYCQCVDQCWNY